MSTNPVLVTGARVKSGSSEKGSFQYLELEYTRVASVQKDNEKGGYSSKLTGRADLYQKIGPVPGHYFIDLEQVTFNGKDKLKIVDIASATRQWRRCWRVHNCRGFSVTPQEQFQADLLARTVANGETLTKLLDWCPLFALALGFIVYGVIVQAHKR